MKLVWIVSAIAAVMAIIMVVRACKGGWSQRFEETNIPSACIDCNKGNCRGCALEFLTKEQANEIATQLTQQAIADNSIAYNNRFQKEGKRG